ncbi:MAG: phosphatase PAP2 family protein, partial [Gemmatimonadota bacterium]|nr:phosphatase PAP2 family protein [Gemmatimonadota bacterium]
SRVMSQQQSARDSSGAPAGVQLFSARDATIAGAFVVATAAALPFDRHIAIELQRSSLQNNQFLSHTATTFRLISQPGAIGLGALTYVIGRADNSPRAAEVGLRTLESIGAAGVVGVLIKGVVGRARPYVVADSNSHDLHFGRGFHDDGYTSFPSGHTLVAFAAASAAGEEIGYLWPHSSSLITPALFTGATLAALSRVYNDKHWASDVIAGAGVGTVIARGVVRYGRMHPHNKLDRLLLPNAVMPAPDGSMALVWSRPW